MKKTLAIFILIFVVVFSFVACEETIEIPTLTAPANVRAEGGHIVWNPVDHASKYTISIDGKEYFCVENKYPVSGISDGEHTITVKANGDDIAYRTSLYSEPFTLNLLEGTVASGGYYSQFDELTMKESFLGYGFDVINSSVFYDKTVKTSSPIFDNSALMNLRLLKVDSKRSYVDEVQSADIESFMNSWNANLNVDVSWGKKRIGGSVDVAAAYSGGSETAKSKYYHCMTFNNQKFYIVMQGTTDQYRNMLSAGFEQDLYSNMSPAELFNKYGTHFITSAVMGGKINSYYLYSSEKETSFHDVSAAVSTNVRYWVGSTNVEVSGGYRQLAAQQNIYIKNTLEVIGGGDVGMLSDSDIGSKYADWEKSLEDHPSLIGIKDSASLWPIWELIDPAKDTRTDYTWTDESGKLCTGTRAQQLQGYFLKYGVDNYNLLAQEAGIPEIKEPESISNILVNGKGPVNGVYEVYSGIGNRITFTVSPEDAIGFSKIVRLSEASDYVTIDEANSEIIVADSIPTDYAINNTLTVIVSCGDVKETIKIRIIKTYDVNFIVGMNDDVQIENPELYYGIKHGNRITQPTMVEKYDKFIFKGWFTDDTYNNKFDFDNTTITSNLTLYAKWEVFRPTISFVTNINGFVMEPVSIDYKTKFVPNATPACDGYIFKGFFTDVALTEEFDMDLLLIRDFVLYLKWEPIEYTATFVAEGVTVETITYTMNDTSLKEPKVPKKDNYDGKWEDYTITVGGMTINAEYSLIEYTVTLNVLDETPVVSEYSAIDFGATIKLDKPLRNDYLFMGWYDNPDFEGEPIKELTEPKDYSLYAKHLVATINEDTSISGAYYHINYASNTEDEVFVVPDMHNDVLVTFISSQASFPDSEMTIMLPESVTTFELGTSGSITIETLRIEGTVTNLSLDFVSASSISIDKMILGDSFEAVNLDFVDVTSCNIFIPESVSNIIGDIGLVDEEYGVVNIYFEAEEAPENMSINKGTYENGLTINYYYDCSLEDFEALQ